MDESTPGGVSGARSPGVGAEVTPDLSQHSLPDSPPTWWNENNTEEVNDSTDWMRQLDYLLVNSWSLQSSSDFSEALLSQHPVEQGSERFEVLTFDALHADMSESMATDTGGSSVLSPRKLLADSKPGIETKMSNGKPMPLALIQHANEMSLSQHPVAELSLSQYPIDELSLSQCHNGKLLLSQHPLDELSLSQHPIDEPSLSQCPNGKMLPSQHPVDEMSLFQHPVGEMSLSQHPAADTSPLDRETSLSQYPLENVSDLTEKQEMSSLQPHAVMSEESPIMAGNIIPQEWNVPVRPVLDVGVDQQLMTSGYSSLATVASNSCNGQHSSFASLKSDVTSVGHETMPSQVNGNNYAEEDLMGSEEIVSHVTICEGPESADGCSTKHRAPSEDLCKPSKAESEGSEFDSGRSESSMSSQSQPSVVGVQADHLVAIGGSLCSGENGTPGLELVYTPTGGTVIQHSKVRQPVCTSTPSSGNDSGGSQESIPQRVLLKQQVDKHSLDSLVGQGPDSGCASLAPSAITSQGCVASVDMPTQPAPSDDDPYMNVNERAKLLTEQTDAGGTTGQLTDVLDVATVCDSDTVLAQAMSSYEDELIRTANELGISTEMAKADLMVGGVDDGHTPVDSIPQNGERSFTIYEEDDDDDDDVPAKSGTEAEPGDKEIVQNGVYQHDKSHPHNQDTMLLSTSSPSRSTAVSLIHSGSHSMDSGKSKSSGALAEMVRSLTTGMNSPEIAVDKKGTVGSLSDGFTSPEPLDAMLAEKAHVDLQNLLNDLPIGQPHDNLQNLLNDLPIGQPHDNLQNLLNDLPLGQSHDDLQNLLNDLPLGQAQDNLQVLIDSGPAETSSTTSGATLGSMDKDVERIANEYIAILKGGAQVGKSGKMDFENDSASGNAAINGGQTFSQYSGSSATTYNELPRMRETAAYIGNTHTVVIVTENANGSVDGSTQSSSSDTEDALDRDVRRILAKYGRTLSDDEDVNSSKAGKKNHPLPVGGTLSDSDDASSLSRRVHNLLNSGTETASTVQQPLYLFDDPARSMSIPSGSSTSPNSVVPSLKQPAPDGVRDGARTPSPRSLQSTDSLGQRVQNLLIGPDSHALPPKHGHASSVSSQSSVIDYTNLERELDEIQSSLASITSADGLRSRHASISSQVSENVKLTTATNLARTYTFEKGTDDDGHSLAKAAASERSEKAMKFSVNPMLTSGLVPVDIALDIMHGTATNNPPTGTISRHQSAANNSIVEEQTCVKSVYGLDRNNSNAARDSSIYSSDNDGESLRLMDNEQVQDVSRLVAEILERGSPPRQAYRYLHEAEQRERSLDSRKSVIDHSTDLLPDNSGVLNRSHLSAAVATPSGTVRTTSDSFTISPLAYTPLNAFRTANNLFSTQLSKFGLNAESVSPSQRYLHDMSPSASRQLTSGETEGEGHLQNVAASDRKQVSTMSVESRAEDHSFVKAPIEHARQRSPFRGQSTLIDTPVSTTRDVTVSRYSSILPDTTSLIEKSLTSPSRPRSAIRAREYEKELEGTGAATSGPSVLERRPKSSSPMLRPYRPLGSLEYYYVENSVDDGSASVAMSETTVESTHAGSDDARAPPFPSYVLGSRKDTLQNMAGIYSHHRTSPSREMSPPSGGQRLGTIAEQSFESRDMDGAQKQQLTQPPPEVSLNKERSFHQTREWLNSGSFASRRHDDEADTSGSVAANNSSAASGDVTSVNRCTLSPPGGHHDLLNSTVFATPQKYGTSFHATTSSPRDHSVVDSTGRKRFEEKVLWKKENEDSSFVHHTNYHRRCHSVNPRYDDGQGYTKSTEVTTRRCYSETPNDRSKFSPLSVDEFGGDGLKTRDALGKGDHRKISSPLHFRGSTGQLASGRSPLPTGQSELDDQHHSQVLAARFQSHLGSAERTRYSRLERPRSTGSILDEGQGDTRKVGNRYLSEQRSPERCLPGERARLFGGGDLYVSPRFKDAKVGDTLKSDVTSCHRAAIYEQHADVMNRLQVSPPNDQRRMSDWDGRVRERARESPTLDMSRRSCHTVGSTVDDTARIHHSVDASSRSLVSDLMKEDGRAKQFATEHQRDTRFDVASTRGPTLTRDPSLKHDSMSTCGTNSARDQATRPRQTKDNAAPHSGFERSMTRQPDVTFDPQHDPSLPLGINELWRRFQQIETTLDALKSTSNTDTSRIIQLLQSHVRTQGGTSVDSSPLRTDIPASEFQRFSPGSTTPGGNRQTDHRRNTNDRKDLIEGRNKYAGVTASEVSKPSSVSYQKSFQSGFTNEAVREGDGRGHRDLGSKTPVTKNTTRNHDGNVRGQERDRQSYERNGQSHERNGQSHERNGQSHERNGQSHERNGQSHERNGQSHERNGQSHERNGQSNERNRQSHERHGQSHEGNGQNYERNGQNYRMNGEGDEEVKQGSEGNTSQNNKGREEEGDKRRPPPPDWTDRDGDKGQREKGRPTGGRDTGSQRGNVEGKTKKTAWLIKDETLLSIPEDTTLESLSSDFTTTTTALSTTSDLDNDGRHVVVVTQTSKRHLPDDPRLLRLQQKIWRQKEMHRREQQREKRRREKIHKLERLLAEKAQQRIVVRGGSSDTPSTGGTDSMDTASDITMVTTSAQLSDDGGSSTLVEDDETSTEVVCICQCLKSAKTKSRKSPIKLQEVDHVKATRKVNHQQYNLNSDKFAVPHSKRHSPSRRAEDIENQPRHPTRGKRHNGMSGQRDFGATFPSPMVVSPAVRRSRLEGDVVMVSEAVQTSRPPSPDGRDGGEKGRSGEQQQPLQSTLNLPPYSKMQLTLEKAKQLAAAVDDSSAMTAHPGGFSWFIPVKKGEKTWGKREPLREFQENLPKDAWPPQRADPKGDSEDIDRIVSGKWEEIFAPFNRWTIEKPEKKFTLQDAFAQKMQRFISRSHERVRHMGLKAEERHVQELHRFERVRLFGTACGGNVLDEKAPRSSHKADVDPYTDQLFKPRRRNVTKHEMKRRTSRVYRRVSEVTAQVQEKKRQESYKTNRLRAQLYKQKILNRVLNKRGPMLE